VLALCLLTARQRASERVRCALGRAKTTFFPVSPAQAQAIHGDPKLWHTWIDGAQDQGDIVGDGLKGTTCSLRIKAGGLTQPYIIQVLETVPGESGGSFVAEMSSPIMNVQETWNYLPEGSGTRATWRFDFQPVGVRGFLLRPFLGRVVSRSMERSGSNLLALCQKET
jgi:hypothetical protein